MHIPARHPTVTTRRPENSDKTGDVDLSIVCALSSIGIWLTCLVTVAVSASVTGLVLVLLAGVGLAATTWHLITAKQ